MPDLQTELAKIRHALAAPPLANNEPSEPVIAAAEATREPQRHLPETITNNEVDQ